MTAFDPGRIREARVSAGLSQEDLAYAMRTLGYRVSVSTISRWERGRNAVRADMLPALAEATGKNVEFFYRPTHGDPCFMLDEGEWSQGERR
jgi:transcriptional regulator with XRE-family HTH domain